MKKKPEDKAYDKRIERAAKQAEKASGICQRYLGSYHDIKLMPAITDDGKGGKVELNLVLDREPLFDCIGIKLTPAQLEYVVHVLTALREDMRKHDRATDRRSRRCPSQANGITVRESSQ